MRVGLVSPRQPGSLPDRSVYTWTKLFRADGIGGRRVTTSCGFHMAAITLAS